MTENRRITFYHSPYSRAAGVRALLEELGADYELKVLDLTTQQERQPEYLAVNPMGKVPAIVHNGVLVTEQAAVYMYLAELYPEAGLAPAVGDPLRGAYLRWMVFYGSCFEPALVDKSMEREAPEPSRSPYGTYDDVMNTLNAQLARGPYILGERFTAADVLWGVALAWTVGFGIVPGTPVIKAYIERITSRPAIVRAKALDTELGAQLSGGTA